MPPKVPPKPVRFLESSFCDDSSRLIGDLGTGDMSDEFLLEFKKVEFEAADSWRCRLSTVTLGILVLMGKGSSLVSAAAAPSAVF